mgnify:CR=1 FL=1
MKLPWKVEKKIELPSDKKLEEIKKILFPELMSQQNLKIAHIGWVMLITAV